MGIEITCADSDGSGTAVSCGGGGVCDDSGHHEGVTCKCDVEGYAGNSTANKPATCHSKVSSAIVLLNVKGLYFNEDLNAQALLKQVIAGAVNIVYNRRRRRSLLETSEIETGMLPASSPTALTSTDIGDLKATSDDQYLTTIFFSATIEGLTVEEFGDTLQESITDGTLSNEIVTVFQESQFTHALLAVDESEAGFETTRFYEEQQTNSVVGSNDDEDYNILVGACVAFAVIIIVLLVFALIVFRRKDDDGEDGAEEVAMSTIPKHHTTNLDADTHHEL